MKKALIIGGNSGIAQALKQQLQNHYSIEVLSRENTDYSDQSLQLSKLRFEQSGPFQLIVNCIGVLQNQVLSPEKRIEHLSQEVLLEYFRVNTILPAMCMKYFIGLLDRENQSVYINLSAMVGSIDDNRLGGWYGYRSSKAALNMMVKNAAIELIRRNKKACLVAMHPGTTQTELSKPFSAKIDKDKYYTPEQSAERILSVAADLSVEDMGKFFNWDGTEINWRITLTNKF